MIVKWTWTHWGFSDKKWVKIVFIIHQGTCVDAWKEMSSIKVFIGQIFSIKCKLCNRVLVLIWKNETNVCSLDCSQLTMQKVCTFSRAHSDRHFYQTDNKDQSCFNTNTHFLLNKSSNQYQTYHSIEEERIWCRWGRLCMFHRF